MTLNKWLNAGPDFVFGDIPQADRNREAAVIGARLVGTCFALVKLRGGMDWREPLGDLRAEESECRDAAKRGEMTGS